MNILYRFVVNDTGIYEAVEQDCPRNDPRRQHKPDGAWLPRVGETYPGAISFWTAYGLSQYINSGLMAWHTSVVSGEITVIISDQPNQVLYTDPYQVICFPNQINQTHSEDLETFLTRKIPPENSE